MKPKKRIKILETTVSQLQKQVEKSALTITDASDPNLKAVISLNNGEFTIEKIRTNTTETETSELIIKDNK
ncbi:hypothetical protein [Flavobacterium hydrophilum]|uniref:Uncharacterized protein n=1 Tax=Flavobacterium hydrophilum TaxID=2211445 RepID=A0A2V4BZR2_9FLAO|nr:hypothetical protein [Flavobacterium hydrophilum]PXY44536.1 hypothetical protein DMB68_13795 [Flavobacterium hydrophilum]